MKFSRNELLMRSPLLASLVLVACASQPKLIPEPLAFQRTPVKAGNVIENGSRSSGLEVSEIPKPPITGKNGTEAPAKPKVAGEEKADITLTFDQMPLPTFIQAVYGSVLKKNFSLDPQVASRQDLVTLRTGKAVTPSELEDTSRAVLKSYGIAVVETGNFVRLVPDSGANAYAAEIRRGRALPETPLPLRPIFYYVELQSSKPSDVSWVLKQMFTDKVKIDEDPAHNSLLLTGQASDISALLDALQVLDQPMLRGRRGVKLSPAYWSADELTKRLAELMTAQGIPVGVGNGNAANAPVYILPVQAVNSIYVFAADQKVLDLATSWARELDKPNGARGSGYVTYPVKYTDAEELAATLRELPGLASAAPAQPGAKSGSGKVVVNRATNSLILQANSDEYTRLLALLQELDRPAKTALIEVTVAEVTLTAEESLGLEWAFSNANGAGTYSGGTLNNLGVSSIGGLTVKLVNNLNAVRGVLSALATDNRAKILSTPRVMARNGETASIEVGQEVPIVTSQQSSTTNNTGTNNNIGVLQTIQYRSTGVILKVKPVIHAGDRVELEVSQEVSSAGETKTGVTSSPTIAKRKVDTRLSIQDGATVLLGGLMSQNDSDNDAGVPYLKDVPVLGQLFSAKTKKKTNTELVILITPYVIHDDTEARAVTEAFRQRLGTWGQSSNAAAVSAPVTVKNPVDPLPVADQRLPVEGLPQPATASQAPAVTMPDVVDAQQATTEIQPDSQVTLPGAQTGGLGAPIMQLPGGGSGQVVSDPALLQEVLEAQKKSGKKPVKTTGTDTSKKKQ